MSTSAINIGTEITQTAGTNNSLDVAGHVVAMPPEMTYLLIALAFVLIMTLIIGVFKLIRYKIKVERCKCPIGATVDDHEVRIEKIEAWMKKG